MIDKSTLKGACIVGQSGGPSSVINASLYGIVKQAMKEEAITRVYGAVYGIKGILRGELMDFSEEDEAEIDLLPTTPSSALGSCRYKLNDAEADESDYIAILELFKKYDVRYFYYIGGNDSMDTCDKLNKYFKSVGYDCRVMGVAKTIDNDIYGTDHCPGYGSAAKYVASTFMEIFQDATVYDIPQVVIVEVMGRNAGWLTAASALASHYGNGPDFIYLPEVPFDLEDFLCKVEDRIKYDRTVVVAVSEGIRDENGTYISEYDSLKKDTDSFGHVQMGGLAATLKEMIKERVNVKVRGIELSLLQRCAAHIASETDMEEAIKVGKKAVCASIDGMSGYMVGLKRISNEPYETDFEMIDLSKAANFEQTVPLSWIGEDKCSVTEDFIKYAAPLIKGETNMKRENGLPRFAKLKKKKVQ